MGDHRVPVRNSHGDTSTKNPQACTGQADDAYPPDGPSGWRPVSSHRPSAQEKSRALPLDDAPLTSLVRRLGFLPATLGACPSRPRRGTNSGPHKAACRSVFLRIHPGTFLRSFRHVASSKRHSLRPGLHHLYGLHRRAGLSPTVAIAAGTGDVLMSRLREGGPTPLAALPSVKPATVGPAANSRCGGFYAHASV